MEAQNAVGGFSQSALFSKETPPFGYSTKHDRSHPHQLDAFNVTILFFSFSFFKCWVKDDFPRSRSGKSGKALLESPNNTSHWQPSWAVHWIKLRHVFLSVLFLQTLLSKVSNFSSLARKMSCMKKRRVISHCGFLRVRQTSLCTEL